jgi:hypothetical protein
VGTTVGSSKALLFVVIVVSIPVCILEKNAHITSRLNIGISYIANVICQKNITCAKYGSSCSLILLSVPAALVVNCAGSVAVVGAAIFVFEL